MSRRGNNYPDMNKALQKGIEMPPLGLGTFRLANQDLIYESMSYAMKTGKDLSDLSRENRNVIRYDYEKFLMRHRIALKETCTTMNLPPVGTPKNITEGFMKVLEKAGTDYFDLHLLHFRAPPPLFADRIVAKTWMAVAKLYEESQVRDVDITSLRLSHVMQISEVLAVGPMYKQIEWHPRYYQPDVMKYFCEQNIYRQSCSAFGGTPAINKILMEQTAIQDIAERHKTSCGRVVLSWALKRGFAVMPQGASAYHMRETRSVYFKMSENEMVAMDTLSVEAKKYQWDPNRIA